MFFWEKLETKINVLQIAKERLFSWNLYLHSRYLRSLLFSAGNFFNYLLIASELKYVF